MAATYSFIQKILIKLLLCKAVAKTYLLEVDLHQNRIYWSHDLGLPSP